MTSPILLNIAESLPIFCCVYAVPAIAPLFSFAFLCYLFLIVHVHFSLPPLLTGIESGLAKQNRSVAGTLLGS